MTWLYSPQEKFGIRRERQPFVLTHDFVYVIQKGSDSNTQSFEDFKSCCMEVRDGHRQGDLKETFVGSIHHHTSRVFKHVSAPFDIWILI